MLPVCYQQFSWVANHDADQIKPLLITLIESLDPVPKHGVK